MLTLDISCLLWHIDTAQLKTMYLIRLGMLQRIIKTQPNILNACILYMNSVNVPKLYKNATTIYFLEWLHKYRPVQKNIFYDILEQGKLAIARHLYKLNPNLNVSQSIHVCGCNLDVVKYVYKYITKEFDYTQLHLTIDDNNIDKIRWLRTIRPEILPTEIAGYYYNLTYIQFYCEVYGDKYISYNDMLINSHRCKKTFMWLYYTYGYNGDLNKLYNAMLLSDVEMLVWFGYTYSSILDGIKKVENILTNIEYGRNSPQRVYRAIDNNCYDLAIRIGFRK